VVKTLYCRSYDGILICCQSRLEAWEDLKEAYGGLCDAHQPGPKLKDRLHWFSYYWPTMIFDAVEYARRCKACQIHVDFIHQPPELLHPTVISWPFKAWGIDVIRPISPRSVKGHWFILALIDYLSKWAKAVPLVDVKTTNMVNFIKHNIIHRFGVPRRFIHDNGPYL